MSATAPRVLSGVSVRPRGMHRYGVLLIVTVLLVGVEGIARPSPLQQLTVTLLAGASLVLALRAADIDRRVLVAGSIIAAVILVLAIVRATAGGIGDGVARVMNAALVCLGPPAVALGVVRDLRASRQVRIASLMGVLSLYMLIGMLFAFTYGAIDLLGDDPFFADGDPATRSNCLYFSFVTLATVGYGDLVAAGQLGHTLAVFESLLGQIYLVTIVSLLVSNLGRPTRTRVEDG